MKLNQNNFLLDFLRHAKQYPNSEFLKLISKTEVKQYSYSDLLKRSLAYATKLREQGVGRGDSVIIILEHCEEMYFSFLGAMLIGAIPSFLPFQTPKQDPQVYWKSQIELFKRIQTKALITYESNLSLLENYISDLKELKIILPREASAVDKLMEIREDDILTEESIAFLQHSSGTTGLKKGVSLSYQAVTRQIENYSKVLRLTKEDKIASWLPLYHDMGLIATFILPISKGLEIVSMDPFEWVMKPVMLLEAIEKYRASLCWLPNFAYHHLIRLVDQKRNFDLSSLRALINCSEPCRAETFEEFYKRFSKNKLKKESLQVCYAMAETVYAVSNTELGIAPRVLAIDVEDAVNKAKVSIRGDLGKSQKCISAGKTIDGIRAVVVSEQGDILEERRIGEILLQGDFLFSGYFKDPVTTAKKIVNGWYHTGDLGFLDNSELFVLGRMDDVIISHGKKFAAHDLEQVVCKVEGIKPGRVIAMSLYREDIGSDEIIIVAERDGKSEMDIQKTSREVKKAIFDEFGLAIWQAKIEDTGWIIKTTSGKLCRKENLDKFKQQSSS